MKLPIIFALVSHQDSLSLEIVILKATFISISRIFENTLFLLAELVFPFEIVILSFLLSLSMQDIIFELSAISSVGCVITSLSVAST